MTSRRYPAPPSIGRLSSSSSSPQPPRATDPFLSVVVPVYNDPAGIRTTLESLVVQTVPTTGYEVVVVDNDSTDDTRSVVREFTSRYEHVHLVVEDEVQGSYAARNRGIRAARGSILAFVDADMSVDPDWLRRAVTVMEGVEADYLACAVHLYAPDGEETLVGKFNRLTDLRVERLIRTMRFAPTCSLLVRRSLLEEVGAFDPRFRSSGDLEFGHRVDERGRRMHFAPHVLLYHPARSSIRAVLKKSFRIGRGKIELHRYHPERYGHPVRRLANPLVYLPPAPSYVRSSVQGWDELPAREKVGFYLLAYGSQLAKAVGQLREAVSLSGRGGAQEASARG